MRKKTNKFLLLLMLYIALSDITYAYDSKADKKSCRERGYQENSPEYWKCIDEKFKLKEEYKPPRPHKALDFPQQDQKIRNQLNRIYNNKR